ncbi:MAG: ABC transporter permease [Candidatus Delongbacteria bacterium]|nr:ABC transporter permease [Candidatus Delongbacteria bacterium]
MEYILDSFDIIIEPKKRVSHYWKELWLYRELFFFFAWRDIKVQYKQTIIGVLWAVLRPFLTMVVFTVIFGKIAKLPSSGIPYPIMVFSAMLPWQLFASSLSQSSNSIINNSNMITKIYFPRIIIPSSAVIVSFVDFAISSVILVLMMFYYGFIPDFKLLTLPLFLIVALSSSFGIGLWFSALNVKYRDIRYVVPFLVQFGMYVSPVGFSSDIIPEKWRLLYSMNPMVGVIDGFRWALSGGKSDIFDTGFYISIGISFIILISGFLYFRKAERGFADEI